MLDATRQVDIVDWKLIGSCNLRCRHCYGPPKTERSLPLQVLYKITDQFAKLSPEWVVLTGGEPLLVPDIDKVMERITSGGTKISLSTNTSFFRRHQQAIEEHVSSLNIPLDGSTPEIHALSRDDTSTYGTFFGVLTHYQAHQADKPELLRVGTVYSAANRNDLIPMARKLEPFADVIDRWKIYELIDYTTQRDLRNPIIHTPGEFEKETCALVKELEGSPLASKIMLSPANARDKAYFMVNPRGVVVMPTDVRGVCHEVPIGHILDEPLPEILERWNKKVDPSHYFGNHAHYERQGGNVRLAVLN